MFPGTALFDQGKWVQSQPCHALGVGSDAMDGTHQLLPTDLELGK